VGRAVRIGQRVAVEVHCFRCVDDVLDNIDSRMMDIHIAKIAGARVICDTLYEGYAPVVLEGVEDLAAAKAAATPALSEEERTALLAADAIVAAATATAAPAAAPAAAPVPVQTKTDDVSEDPN